MDAYTELGVIAEDLADHVCACLASTTSGSPDECTVYWSTPPDDLDCGDCNTNGALFVWLTAQGITDNWPTPYGGPIAKHHPTVFAELNLRLIRPCWPKLGDTDMPQPLPTRATTAAKAVNLFEDASAVLCCLVTEAKLGHAGIFGACSRVALGVLRPDPNRGGCAGFTVPVTVDLGACCTPAI